MSEKKFCMFCGGTGRADTGGFYPWGEPIFAACECIHEKDGDEMNFKRGDIIRNKGTGQSYVVIGMVDGHVVAGRTVEVSNPIEWESIDGKVLWQNSSKLTIEDEVEETKGDRLEYRYQQMQSALIRIMIWAEHDALSRETRQKAMADIAKECDKALHD